MIRISKSATVRLECEPLEDRVTPATLTWLGAVDGLWSHAGNWSTTDVTHPVPQTGDDLIFPAAAANLVQTDDLPALTLSTLTFQGDGYQISDPNGITLTGGVGPTGIPTPGITLAGSIADSIANVLFDTSARAGIIQFSSSNLSHLSIAQLMINGPSDRLTSFDVFGPASAGGPYFSTLSAGSMQVNGMVSIEIDQSVLDIVPGGVFQLPQSARLSLPDQGGIVVENGALFNDFGLTTVGQTSGFPNNTTANMYVAGTVMVGQTNLTVGSGLLFIEPTGQLYVAGTLHIGATWVFPEDPRQVFTFGGELYNAGLVVVQDTATLFMENPKSSCVVAPGGDLYAIGLVQAVQGSQFYIYGVAQIVGTGTAGLYVYDSILNVQSGGALYAYGLVAIEPNSAFYDYGLFALEPSGYLYDAGLFVVEPGGVFYDYGPFVAPGGIYYNFGQQIGFGQ